MTLEKGSLILLDYTAKIKDTNEIFETTRVDDIKNDSNFDPNKKYEPRLLGVGEGWVLKGLDEALLESSIGTPLDIEIPPEKAFGERDPSKVRMIPLRKLGEKANEVGIGDVIEIDDRIGIIRFIGSGRVQVDFNHKYAGRTLVYNANILKKLESDDEKITNLIHRRLPIELSEIKFENNESEIQISLPENTFLIEGIQIIKRGISADIFKFVPNIKSVIFLEKYDNTSTKNDATKQADFEESPDTNIESKKEDSNSEQQSESTDDANKLDGTDATKNKS
ncbi:peptidylprolyl isomerase [Candidatus Nitrosocosmicus sp. SS]|jgi:peptidylprolyl isomerase|uniref:peptidylprolyl isomerase n=1 Tax=Candidatus Nitrosocosmicus agrestis TaxID=2563600 RepID=UPI00122E2422|nr:peptidylprolyl isomerase [Candidatus Nitrosocosmicus sp. SS]KAA2281948.1 peptidylprolyl isomerase [Candidatus Nitrosocosmicus sp. SS]KAF0869853.1 peptidylprolyl isomerase [Candidatus Nitrosocosmicus sp. SS]MDR4490643.1 peptidylprolyl isomerase [Candidatus Nitrosocosmicus sp.]